MTWIVSTNTNHCRIYLFDDHHKKITLLKEFLHPENRQKTSEYFTSDKPGHFKSGTTAHGAYEPHTDPKTSGIEHFSREIAHALDQARSQNAYKKLIFIAPPKMLGFLHEHCNKHIKQLIVNEIQKDIVHYTDYELLNFLKDQ